MKILFTGGSSLTGYWFIRELVAAGHDVTAIFRREASAYSEDLRRRRVALSVELARPVYGVSFGDQGFLRLVREGGWELLAHHASDVTNYKSPDFDPMAAVQGNARNIAAVVDALRDVGCGKVLLTGSVFENGEGAGSQGLPDVSPYGLSKALTFQVFRFYCARAGVSLGKFVIPNPFGPYEEPRFTAYLMKTWFSGAPACCSSPAYVRDNIHVSLLAKAYARFAGSLPAVPGLMQLNPSGYVESQGTFTSRFAQEMRRRLDLPCVLELKEQLEFPEPRVRINTDVLDARELGWNEAAAWDGVAEYYRQLLGR